MRWMAKTWSYFSNQFNNWSMNLKTITTKTKNTSNCAYQWTLTFTLYDLSREEVLELMAQIHCFIPQIQLWTACTNSLPSSGVFESIGAFITFFLGPIMGLYSGVLSRLPLGLWRKVNEMSIFFIIHHYSSFIVHPALIMWIESTFGIRTIEEINLRTIDQWIMYLAHMRFFPKTTIVQIFGHKTNLMKTKYLIIVREKIISINKDKKENFNLWCFGWLTVTI